MKDGSLIGIILALLIIAGIVTGAFDSYKPSDVPKIKVVKTYQVINGDTTLISIIETKQEE